MKSLLAKLTLKEIGKHIAFLLVSTMLIVSILPANPSLAKYVLEPIQYFVSLTSAEIFGTTAITSIGPISGTTAAGNTLTAGLVNPEGATVSYQWKKATTADGVYLPIEGATSSSYVLQINDNNYYIKVTATGTGEYGGTVSSGYTGPVIATATPLTAIGEITGTGLTGQTLTAGALSPNGATATYQWQKSSTVNGVYENISGAVYNTYTPTLDDVDYFLKVVATGSGIYSGSVSATKGPIGSEMIPVTSIGPINGSTVIGQTLTAGTITPSGATVDYQWQIGNTANGSYTNIEGATSATYLLTSSDNGKYIKVKATGNGLYYQSVTSAYTGPVTAAAVSLTQIGDISGTAQVGQTLTAGALTPSGATATYQWQRYNVATSTYDNIAGATSATYTLVANDFNKNIRVTATGSGTYTGTVYSNAKGPVTARPLTAIGDISGTTVVGQTLTAGTVTPYEATVSYQWQRSFSAGGTYTNITGATSATYTLVAGDVNTYTRVVATGTGAYSGSVTSNATGPVAGAASGNSLTAIGPITGNTYVTGVLTAGTLSPYGATATYQWQRASTLNGTYNNIPGATGKTYTVTGSDKGYYIRVVATGSGNYSNTVISPSADPITACPITAMAAITGTAQIGETVTAGVLTPLGATALTNGKDPLQSMETIRIFRALLLIPTN